jgi:formimidoylglutamate deiminase
LFQGALAGGTSAAGLPLGGLAKGQRADFAVIDAEAPALLGVPPDHLLDALIFSSPQPSVREVFVAGRRLWPRNQDPALAPAMLQAMRELWGG